MKIITRNLTIYEQVIAEIARTELGGSRVSAIEMTQAEFDSFKQEALPFLSTAEIYQLDSFRFKGIQLKIVEDTTSPQAQDDAAKQSRRKK